MDLQFTGNEQTENVDKGEITHIFSGSMLPNAKAAARPEYE